MIYCIQEVRNTFPMNTKGASHMKKEKRFETVYTQGLGSVKILVDRETGVNYLFAAEGYAGGLTILIDKEGKPVITPLNEFNRFE